MGAASPQWKRPAFSSGAEGSAAKRGKELHGLDVWHFRFEKMCFKASEVDDVQESITYIGQSECVTNLRVRSLPLCP